MGAEYEAERGELIKVGLKALKQWDGAGKEADEVDDGRIVLSVPELSWKVNPSLPTGLCPETSYNEPINLAVYSLATFC